MVEDLILKKLDDQSARLQKIEEAISGIAVQDQKILHLQKQVNSLWEKWDKLSGPDGTINQVKNFQAGCPRDSLEKSIGRQWGAIALIGTVVTGGLLKAFGVI